MSFLEDIVSGDRKHNGLDIGCPLFDEKVARDILFVIRGDHSHLLFTSELIAKKIGCDHFVVRRYINVLVYMKMVGVVSSNTRRNIYGCCFGDDDVEVILGMLRKRSMLVYGK